MTRTNASRATHAELAASEAGATEPSQNEDLPTSRSKDLSSPRGWPDWIERGVLIYGPRKGGTTLFQNLLDGGDHLFVYPTELKLKWHLRDGGKSSRDRFLSRSLVPETSSPHLSQDRYRECWASAQRAQKIQGLEQLLRYEALAVFRACMRPPSDVRMWGAKEVGGPTSEIVDAWREMFPKGKVLLILRDPRMVTRAVLTDRRRKRQRLSLRQIFYEALDPVRVLAAQARLIEDEDVLAVTYDDLVSNTPDVMRRVAEFLGIPFHERFLSPTVFAESVVVRTASRRTTAIFRSQASWTSGLSLRERAVIAAVGLAAPLLSRYRIDYGELRSRLGAPAEN